MQQFARNLQHSTLTDFKSVRLRIVSVYLWLRVQWNKTGRALRVGEVEVGGWHFPQCVNVAVLED